MMLMNNCRSGYTHLEQSMQTSENKRDMSAQTVDTSGCSGLKEDQPPGATCIQNCQIIEFLSWAATIATVHMRTIRWRVNIAWSKLVWLNLKFTAWVSTTCQLCIVISTLAGKQYFQRYDRFDRIDVMSVCYYWTENIAILKQLQQIMWTQIAIAKIIARQLVAKPW